jgi:hypothetical protein
MNFATKKQQRLAKKNLLKKLNYTTKNVKNYHGQNDLRVLKIFTINNI